MYLTFDAVLVLGNTLECPALAFRMVEEIRKLDVVVYRMYTTTTLFKLSPLYSSLSFSHSAIPTHTEGTKKEFE